VKKKQTLSQRIAAIDVDLRLLAHNYNAHARDETARVHRIMDARQTPAVGKKGGRYAVGRYGDYYYSVEDLQGEFGTVLFKLDGCRAQEYCAWLNSK